MATDGHRHTQPSLLSCFLLFLLQTALTTQSSSSSSPHIVIIMADDLGWNDVGYRDPEMVTPNINRLAAEGVVLGNSYMQQVCTPSRAAFLSGYYPFHLGLQHSVLSALKNNSMPLGYTLLPQHLKDMGYSTHYVGKWHLGFCSPAMTPTYRGFDTFYGMYNGKGGYFDHVGKWDGYDLHNDTGEGQSRDFSVDWSGKNRYSTELFTERAVQIIEGHDLTTPLLLFLSYQAVHGPLEVPDHYVDRCAHVTSGEERKLHCAMTAAMDDGIGQVREVLERKGLVDNLVTLFTSDNGGPVKLGSSNWPLRGSKITLWEGGTKVVSILHSSTFLPDAPYQWDGLMHAVDWYPTLVRAAGDTNLIPGIDGVDNWESIVQQGDSNRQEFVYNIDDVKNAAAIRVGRYKLIHNKAGKPDGWYNPPAGVINTRTPPRKNPEFQLYDLEADPEETTDLSGEAESRETLDILKTRLAFYNAQLVRTRPSVPIKDGKPKKHGGAWVTGWC